MKKLLIVNNNMKIGGVQKSLCNLLWNICGEYDVTLCLFDKNGEYLDDIPDTVDVIACDSLFRYLGMSQAESVQQSVSKCGTESRRSNAGYAEDGR